MHPVQEQLTIKFLMEDTRRAICDGRRLADEGRYAAAMEAWKAALGGAYTLKDYAGMFVLSGNIGEACVQIATRSKNRVKAMELLREATEHLDYALQVVEQCSLREVMGGYRELYRSVRRVETMRNKAAKLMETTQQVDEQLERKQAKWACMTCKEESGDVVLDENDGCYYCRACYDDYYGAVQVGDGEAAAEDNDLGSGEEDETVVTRYEKVDSGKVVGAVPGEALGVLEGCGQSVLLHQDDEKDTGGGAVSLASDPTDEGVAGAEGDVENESTQRQAEEATPGRIRYERVELGSLADFLAGKTSGESTKEQQVEILQVRDEQVKISTESSHEEAILTESAMFIATRDEKPRELEPAAECPSAPKSGAKRTARAEEVQNEDSAADETDSKRVYSIVELLDLRRHSPHDCPKSLLASPVRDDGTAPTPAHSKPTNSRKKSKKTVRSASSHRQNKTDANPEKTNTVSPLPTPDMVDAMRKILHARRQQTSNYDSVEIATDPMELFGSFLGDRR